MQNTSNAVIVGQVTTNPNVRDMDGSRLTSFVVTVKGKDSDKVTNYEVFTFSKSAANELKLGDNVLIQGQLEGIRIEDDKSSNIKLCINGATVDIIGERKRDLQNIVAIGRTTQDIEVKETTGGHKVARVPVALNHGGDKTTFMEVEVWDGYAETVAKNVKKGNMLSITGNIDLNVYENNNGGTSTRLRIVNSTLGFMQRTTANENTRETQKQATTKTPQAKAPQTKGAPSNEGR